MLQNASIYIRFAVTLILTVAFAVGFRPLSRKLSQKLSPKHPIAEQELIGLGIVPWFAGLLTDSFIMIFPNTTLAFIFISVAAPVGWGVIAFLWEPKVKKIWKVVLFQNLVSAVVFVLICVQMLGSGRFWPGILGSLSQMFHLPFLSLGARLTNWSGSLWPAYCAAFILMLLVSFIGCLISKRRRGEQGEKKRRTAMQMITWLLAGSLMGTWLLCMACLTVGTASYIFDDLCDAGNSMASNAIQLGRLMELYDGEHGSELLETCPGILEFRMLDAIGVVGGTVVRPGELMNYYRDKRSLNIYRDEVLYCDTAAAVFAPDGSIIFESGDFVSFSYISEEDYLAGDESHTAGYAWMDLNDETDTRYSRFRTLYGGTGGLYNIPAMRITGYLDGTRIEPFAISVINRDALYEALDSRTPDEHIAHPDGTEEISHRYTYGGLVAEGLLEWDTLFDYTDTAPEGKELITVYSFYHHMEEYEPGGPVTYQGAVEHENLQALLRTMDYRVTIGETHMYNLYGAASDFSLWEVILFDAGAVRDLRSYDHNDASTYPDPEFYVVTALRASPLGMAMRFLLRTYIITLAAAVIVILSLRSALRRKLVEPIREINDGMTDGYRNLHSTRDREPEWAEPYALCQNYFDTQAQLRINKNEIKRLNTALDYAKTAEQNRRQMTSNIAHELKTPLAVIHSYAEGLREHIAEDKRDKYIEVILSESERMDAMVLEMLDLSRLEAGKVRLARDEFSLAQLTDTVLEKLERAAAAKNLRIDRDFPDDSTITADESRIAQVVENFLSNAVKYTPVGGHIAVTIRRGKQRISFSVENDSKPLSYEALGKVWDTFYRTDEARSGGGTGLGLAIAKNIVELHGGNCSVKNTKTGVEFGFML